ncbi:hypothetical protein D3C75_978030 [compost metagenome]
MNVHLDQNHINSRIFLAGIQLHFNRALRFNLDRNVGTEGGNERTVQRLAERNMLCPVMQLLQRRLDDPRRL